MRRWALTEGVRLHIIEDAGHMVMLDAPQETARVLLDILDSFT